MVGTGQYRLGAEGLSAGHDVCGRAAGDPGVVSAQLGPTLLLAREQLWLRRQYPRAQAPALHAPHSWHQDGALGARFQSPEPLLEMLTLWCPLDDCGRDAPGLELATQHEEILPLATLAQRHSGVCPQMQAGDILVMRGGLLHRSHVSPSMSRVRTSLELRVLPRVPPRLANQAFVEI